MHLPLTESKLIALLASRDKRGMEVLYEKYGGILYYKISAVITDPGFADEILQKTFSTIWGNYSSFCAEKESVYSWINMIALDEIQQFHAQCNISLSKKEMLPFTEMTAIELIFLGGYTREEVAREFSITPEALNGQLRTEMLKIRKAWAVPLQKVIVQ